MNHFDNFLFSTTQESQNLGRESQLEDSQKLPMFTVPDGVCAKR